MLQGLSPLIHRTASCGSEYCGPRTSFLFYVSLLIFSFTLVLFMSILYVGKRELMFQCALVPTEAKRGSYRSLGSRGIGNF